MGKINSKNIIKILAVGFIVVVCPAASWYYLQKGLDYQKNARKEIVVKEEIDISPFLTEYIKQDTTLLDNKLRVVLFNNDSNRDAVDPLVVKLTDQFEDSKGVLLFEVLKISDAQGQNRSSFEGIHIRTVLNDAIYEEMIKNQFGQPTYKAQEGPSVLQELKKNQSVDTDNYPYAALIDHNNGLRNLYDINDPERIKRMVEHMAILIPRVDIEKAELIRAKEL